MCCVSDCGSSDIDTPAARVMLTEKPSLHMPRPGEPMPFACWAGQGPGRDTGSCMKALLAGLHQSLQ